MQVRLNHKDTSTDWRWMELWLWSLYCRLRIPEKMRSPADSAAQCYHHVDNHTPSPSTRHPEFLSKLRVWFHVQVPHIYCSSTFAVIRGTTILIQDIV